MLLTRRLLGSALFVAAGAVGLVAIRSALPVAAQTPLPACGMEPTTPCELTGYKLLPNPNDPAVYVLHIETTEGIRSFVAGRAVVERFARGLLDAVEGRGVKPL